MSSVRFYARFQWGSAAIARVELLKETPKSWMISKEHLSIFGSRYLYLPERIGKDRGAVLFETIDEAVEGLLPLYHLEIDRHKKAVEQAEKSLSEFTQCFQIPLLPIGDLLK